MAMRHRKLGCSSLEISPIGLGILQFGGGSGPFQALFPPVPEETRFEIIKTALEGGINWFDTADLPGAGRSERYLAEALNEINGEHQRVIIAAKWTPYLRFVGNLKKSILVKMNNLDPYPIGLFQIHTPGFFSALKAEIDVMADLVDTGKILAVGASNFNAVQMRRAQGALEKRGLGLASNQVQYNLLNREVETNGVLETARELGISLIAWAPLASGLLTGRFHKNPALLERTPPVRRNRLRKQLETSQPVIEALDAMASKYNSEPARVALAWLIGQGEDILAVSGASRVEHVQECIGAMELNLSADDRVQLDEVSRKILP